MPGSTSCDPAFPGKQGFISPASSSPMHVPIPEITPTGIFTHVCSCEDALLLHHLLLIVVVVAILLLLSLLFILDCLGVPIFLAFYFLSAIPPPHRNPPLPHPPRFPSSQHPTTITAPPCPSGSIAPIPVMAPALLLATLPPTFTVFPSAKSSNSPRLPLAFDSPVHVSGARSGGRKGGEPEEEEEEEKGKDVEGERRPLLAGGGTAARRSGCVAAGEGEEGGAGGGGGVCQSMARRHRPHLPSSASSSPPPPSLSPLPSNTPTPTISKGYDSLTWFDKLELFGLWPTVALLGILCALANTIQSLSSHSHMDAFVEPALRLLLGFACLLLWLASVQYLEF